MPAPGGAWLFARTIFNASNSILASRETPAKLVAELEAERELSLGSTSKADGGLGALSLSVLIAFLRSRGRQENEIPIDITIRDIGSHGSHYRDLLPSDSEPPADETLQGVLRSGGHTSLSELIAAIRRDYESLPAGNPDSFHEAVQTTMASFDIRGEAKSGRLLPRIDRLRNIVVRL
ncbi:hypothetical protein [Mesorhizobium sp.]|uniref:hypothetical protein n=1 Tax=Mesorhizobium sp. TaxID=1871066 RepID=UPI000FEA2C0A|nr:hypothetical protein [Mesorhizobium sp.]RWO92747.1 MAG: hypothetical protein EOQ95_03375 [Mesorhizobium sp.]RWQ57349.1 MAG: hypothetical protein EOS84_07325 [Mesorhizobium sp.]